MKERKFLNVCMLVVLLIGATSCASLGAVSDSSRTDIDNALSGIEGAEGCRVLRVKVLSRNKELNVLDKLRNPAVGNRLFDAYMAECEDGNVYRVEIEIDDASPPLVTYCLPEYSNYGRGDCRLAPPYSTS